MKTLITALAGIVLGMGDGHAAEGAPALEKWRSYRGVSWDAGAGRFAGSTQAPIAGLHFDRKGRAYVSTPRLLSAAAPATLSILDLERRDGLAHLRAFPAGEGNAVQGPVERALRNVLGFHVDDRNGWLWVLDMGFVAGEEEAPRGAQKLLVIEQGSGRIVKAIALDGVADRKGSFLNDVAVDERRKLAYLSDSGLRSAPANQAGIIIVDFASGKARRVLDRHPAVLPAPGAKVVSHGAEVWPGKPLLVGINGIALAPDGETLYWTVTAATTLHAAPTALLRDRDASPERVAASVRQVADIEGNTDGIVFGLDGKLYITDVTRNGVRAYDPGTGALAGSWSSPDIHWPDTAAIGPGGQLYFTASHLNGHFAGVVKEGQERYDIWRIPLKR
jgi:sugar lactone lactonase YvrE